MIFHSSGESLVITPLRDEAGTITHYVGNKKDITLRKRAEAELLRVLASERELSALKDTFVTSMSHEFRTPLAAILNLAELLEDFYERLSPEKRTSYFSSIRQEIARLTGMLQEVLLHGQLGAGKVVCQPQPADLVALCRQFGERAHRLFPKHPPVQFEGDPASPRTLADEPLLEQVLTNLLTNAFKYSPALTPVRLTVRRVGEEWEILVADQGIGIPGENVAGIFTAFARGGNVGSIKGTGLGLFIARACAELHGGRLELRPQAPPGTTFALYLPWRLAQEGLTPED